MVVQLVGQGGGRFGRSGSLACILRSRVGSIRGVFCVGYGRCRVGLPLGFLRFTGRFICLALIFLNVPGDFVQFSLLLFRYTRRFIAVTGQLIALSNRFSIFPIRFIKLSIGLLKITCCFSKFAYFFLIDTFFLFSNTSFFG